MALRRQRSLPALKGISTTMPTAKSCRQSTSAGYGFRIRLEEMPCARKGSAPSQFQAVPPMRRLWIAPPAKPAHDEPISTKTMAATPSAQSVESMA